MNNNSKKIKIITFSIIGVVLLLCTGFLIGYFVIKGDNKYSVSFFVDDELYSQSYANLGESAVFPETPTKFGYQFAGWYNNEDTLITEICENSKTEIFLKAKWNIDTASTYFVFDTISGYKITGLKEDYSSISSIIIPDYVTSIEDYAFLTNESLTTVNFAKNSKCEYIGQYAFEYCTNLKQITIPSSVKQLGDVVFYCCYNLESVTFKKNSSLELIGNGVFADCTSLTEIYIPENVKQFGYGVFSGCTSLEKIVFDKNCSFDSLDDSTFDFCLALQYIVIPSTINNIGASYNFVMPEIYYNGTENDFNSILGKENILLDDTVVYYYSENEPTTLGNFWHYVNDQITKW